MKLIVSDANIFIDMETGGLLEEMFRLTCEIAVPDCVFRSKVATHSGGKLPPIPFEGCHPFR